MAKTKQIRSSSASKSKAKAAPAPKKAIKKAPPARKAGPIRPTAAQAAATKKAVKKAPVKPKNNVTPKSSTKTLDLCLILDCTASMGSWIERSKDTLYQIIESVKTENKGLKVRVSFVAYRDIGEHNRFDVTDFTEDIALLKNKITSQRAMGGADMPEDVQGGFNKALGLSWSADSIKSAFHIADAPGHGKDIYDGGSFGDSYPKGSPDGFKI